MQVTSSTLIAEYAADPSGVVDARQDAWTWFDGRLGNGQDTLRNDVGLLVTELGANVLDHTVAESFRVTIELRDDVVRLQVGWTGVSDDLAPADRWAMPASSSPRGRGLGLVAAIARTVTVVTTGETTTIICDLARS